PMGAAPSASPPERAPRSRDPEPGCRAFQRSRGANTMNDTLKTTATALLIITASLGLSACQSEVPLGEGLARAQGGPCVQGQLTAFADTPSGGPLTLDGQSAYWLQSDGVG